MKNAKQDLVFVALALFVCSLIGAAFVSTPSKAETRENLLRMMGAKQPAVVRTVASH